MKYAVVQVAGKQLKIQEGDVVTLNQEGAPVFEVLLYSDEGKVLLGTPVVENISVQATVVATEKVKTRIARFRSKSRYSVVKGHKQPVSKIKIERIGPESEKASEVKVEAKKAKETKAPTVAKEKTTESTRKTTPKKASTKSVTTKKGSK